MSTHKRKNALFRPLSFDGWGDYQQWAEHDFQPRDPEDESDESETERGPGARTATATAPAEQRIPSPPPPWPESDVDSQAPEPEEVEEDHDFIRARPYVRTGGRAKATYDLRLETMVSSTRLHESPRAMHQPMTADHRTICTLSQHPQSVAEIAARIKAPLGVARILISDAIDMGLLMIHENAPMANGRPPLELLKRVHDGLLRLA
ncbi:DUF742 domain-containing protein [Amycolatopsis cihanbeyliensis]|uniref:Uncharacterized protein DUF742 n=1 Tax=Amycolatopsis cihanbeyliensis TaxID=1128664 RepID=A0A542DR59_AMYCI|nr:DUF742 domain-containing protein [Amycolatopsis cihanbeyliensis]TQJ05592.1 uncharacterized protein DUF742 [Amycolatopsis cihanbeyliensis]